MMTFHDVLRHLVHHSDFPSGTNRLEALEAVDAHEQAETAGRTAAPAPAQPPPGTGDGPGNAGST